MRLKLPLFISILIFNASIVFSQVLNPSDATEHNLLNDVAITQSTTTTTLHSNNAKDSSSNATYNQAISKTDEPFSITGRIDFGFSFLKDQSIPDPIATTSAMLFYNPKVLLRQMTGKSSYIEGALDVFYLGTNAISIGDIKLRVGERNYTQLNFVLDLRYGFWIFEDILEYSAGPAIAYSFMTRGQALTASDITYRYDYLTSVGLSDVITFYTPFYKDLSLQLIQRFTLSFFSTSTLAQSGYSEQNFQTYYVMSHLSASLNLKLTDKIQASIFYMSVFQVVGRLNIFITNTYSANIVFYDIMGLSFTYKI